MMEANEVPVGALRGTTWYLLPRSVTGATAPQIAPAAFVPRQGALQSVLLIDGKCHRPINSNPENCFADANATLDGGATLTANPPR